jgi:hypothetical protein
MWRCVAVLFLLPVAGVAQETGGELACPVRNLFPERSNVVVERKEKNYTWYLIVDQDDRVRCISVRPPGCELGMDKSLGVAIERSGSLTLASYVAADEVPFFARRLSVSPEIVVHFVLTWGPMTESLVERRSDPNAPGYWPTIARDYRHSDVVLYLYLLRETGSSVELLLKEDQGTEGGDAAGTIRGFIDLDFVDATGDGTREAVLSWRNNPTERRLRIWRINADGGVSRLSLPAEVEHRNPVLRPGDDLGLSPRIATTRRERRDEATMIWRYEYGWEDGRGEFVLKHSSAEECRMVRP